MPDTSVIAQLGALILTWLKELSGVVWMLCDTGAEIMESLGRRKAPLRLDEFFFQCTRAGIGSIPMVVLLSLFIGLTMALLTGYQLEIFGIVTLVPAVVSVSFTREMGPLFTGIVLAARIGAAYTAELGAMTAGGEVDAIDGMGIGSLRYLVTPRILAIFCLTPCLSIIAVLSGIAGAAFISNLLLHLGYGFFGDQVMKNLFAKDMLSGLVKSFFFGAIIGIIACYKGLSMKGGAVGVGTATTQSVVASICTVIACDSLCNIAMITFFP